MSAPWLLFDQSVCQRSVWVKPRAAAAAVRRRNSVTDGSCESVYIANACPNVQPVMSNHLPEKSLDTWVGSLDSLKICRRGQSMFRPPKMSHSFIQNCCWIGLTLQVSHLHVGDGCQKWKVKLIYRGA